ncbi:unnamed protein product [Amoebophrya sp. A25]|nr:unnamed protein product [Amoebophrya sp. A25]|eukprot:GSA25T00000476001.1
MRPRSSTSVVRSVVTPISIVMVALTTVALLVDAVFILVYTAPVIGIGLFAQGAELENETIPVVENTVPPPSSSGPADKSIALPSRSCWPQCHRDDDGGTSTIGTPRMFAHVWLFDHRIEDNATDRSATTCPANVASTLSFLSQFLHLDVYGPCAQTPALGWNTFYAREREQEVDLREYLFVLTWHAGIVWEAVSRMTLPVFFGQREDLYVVVDDEDDTHAKEVVNLSEFPVIFAQDFATPHHLTFLLQKLTQHPALYNNYFSHWAKYKKLGPRLIAYPDYFRQGGTVAAVENNHDKLEHKTTCSKRRNSDYQVVSSLFIDGNLSSSQKTYQINATQDFHATTVPRKYAEVSRLRVAFTDASAAFVASVFEYLGPDLVAQKSVLIIDAPSDAKALLQSNARHALQLPLYTFGFGSVVEDTSERDETRKHHLEHDLEQQDDVSSAEDVGLLDFRHAWQTQDLNLEAARNEFLPQDVVVAEISKIFRCDKLGQLDSTFELLNYVAKEALVVKLTITSLLQMANAMFVGGQEVTTRRAQFAGARMHGEGLFSFSSEDRKENLADLWAEAGINSDEVDTDTSLPSASPSTGLRPLLPRQSAHTKKTGPDHALRKIRDLVVSRILNRVVHRLRQNFAQVQLAFDIRPEEHQSSRPVDDNKATAVEGIVVTLGEALFPKERKTTRREANADGSTSSEKNHVQNQEELRLVLESQDILVSGGSVGAPQEEGTQTFNLFAYMRSLSDVFPHLLVGRAFAGRPDETLDSSILLSRPFYLVASQPTTWKKETSVVKTVLVQPQMPEPFSDQVVLAKSAFLFGGHVYFKQMLGHRDLEMEGISQEDQDASQCTEDDSNQTRRLSACDSATTSPSRTRASQQSTKATVFEDTKPVVALTEIVKETRFSALTKLSAFTFGSREAFFLHILNPRSGEESERGLATFEGRSLEARRARIVAHKRRLEAAIMIADGKQDARPRTQDVPAEPDEDIHFPSSLGTSLSSSPKTDDSPANREREFRELLFEDPLVCSPELQHHLHVKNDVSEHSELRIEFLRDATPLDELLLLAVDNVTVEDQDQERLPLRETGPGGLLAYEVKFWPQSLQKQFVVAMGVEQDENAHILQSSRDGEMCPTSRRQNLHQLLRKQIHITYVILLVLQMLVCLRESFVQHNDLWSPNVLFVPKYRKLIVIDWQLAQLRFQRGSFIPPEIAAVSKIVSAGDRSGLMLSSGSSSVRGSDADNSASNLLGSLHYEGDLTRTLDGLDEDGNYWEQHEDSALNQLLADDDEEDSGMRTAEQMKEGKKQTTLSTSGQLVRRRALNFLRRHGFSGADAFPDIVAPYTPFTGLGQSPPSVRDAWIEPRSDRFMFSYQLEYLLGKLQSGSGRSDGRARLLGIEKREGRQELQGEQHCNNDYDLLQEGDDFAQELDSLVLALRDESELQSLEQIEGRWLHLLSDLLRRTRKT